MLIANYTEVSSGQIKHRQPFDMAGIGLTLRKLVADQAYLSGAAAYFSSGVISAGPWLISVISLALLQGALTGFLAADNRQLLCAPLNYAFIGSLILTGPIQFVLTRVVADRIFSREFNAITPIFTSALIEVFAALLLIVLPFVLRAPFDVSYRLLTASLFLTISLLWLALTAIAAAQDYASLVLSFVLGYMIS